MSVHSPSTRRRSSNSSLSISPRAKRSLRISSGVRPRRCLVRRLRPIPRRAEPTANKPNARDYRDEHQNHEQRSKNHAVSTSPPTSYAARTNIRRAAPVFAPSSRPAPKRLPRPRPRRRYYWSSMQCACCGPSYFLLALGSFLDSLYLRAVRYGERCLSGVTARSAPRLLASTAMKAAPILVQRAHQASKRTNKSAAVPIGG